MWQLSQQWYGDRLDPNYVAKPREELQPMLTSVGLVDVFWQLR